MHSKPSRNAEPGRKRQIGINLFPVIVSAPLMALLAFVSFIFISDLQRIKNLALSTSNSHLPQVLAKQQMLLNVENMRRSIALVYSSSDPTISRNAGITAQALIAESVFEETSLDFSSKMNEIKPQLLRLIELKQQNHQAEDRLHDGEISFSNVLGRLFIRSGIEYGYPLRHSARHLGKEFASGTANRQGLQESLRPLMGMCAKAERAEPPDQPLLKDCAEFRAGWEGIASSWAQLARGQAEAKELWGTLDGKLRELSDAVSTHEAEWIYRSMSHINEEVSRIEELFPIMGAAVFAGLLATLLLIHLQILRPLSLLSQALRTIRSGRPISELPRVRIRELQDVLDVLPDISRHMDELNTRSGQLAQERDQYADLSFRDALTGVYNRRALEETMERIPARTPLALLMLDLDFFKNYNDRFGHQAGDAALKAVAQATQKALLRNSDRIFRYGGEEFTTILAGGGQYSAMTVAQRILEEVAALNLPHPDSQTGRLTVSIGIAHRPSGDDQEICEVLAHADQALYKAKTSGRNRIALFGE